MKTLNLVAMLILGTSAPLHAKEGVAKQMLGLWREESPTVHAVTLRKADGTYRRKEIQSYDEARAPITYSSAGHWEARRQSYTFKMESVSTPVWKRYIGRRWTVRLIKIQANQIDYFSTDGAIVSETKIGTPSDADFEKVTLKKL